MAFLSGEKHLLYIADENTWGQSPTSVASSGWYPGFPCYTRPGTKPSLQGGIIPGQNLGQVMGFGRTRTSVSGSYSFYLPTYSATTGSHGFMVLLKHLYGKLGAYTSSDALIAFANGSTDLTTLSYIKNTFSKADVALIETPKGDTVAVNTLSTGNVVEIVSLGTISDNDWQGIGADDDPTAGDIFTITSSPSGVNANATVKHLAQPTAYTSSSGLSFLSVYDDKEIYLYRGACLTGMTINASDPNSLVTVDESFIA